MCIQICSGIQDDAYEQEYLDDDYSKSLAHASIRICVNYLSDKILSKGSWIAPGNDPGIVK